MLKNRFYGVLVVLLVLSLFTIACGTKTASNSPANASSSQPKASTPAASGQKIVIKVGHQVADTTALHKGAIKFKELVEKNSNGQMEVQLFPSGQLGNEKDSVEANKLGTMQISIPSTAMVANFAPKATALTLPYVIKGANETERYASFKKLAKSDVYKEIVAEVNAAGLQIIPEAVWWYGDRQITTKSKPINTPADLKGLKIRTPDAKAHTEPFKIMGANVTPMAFGDIYMALQTGTIEAQENPVSIIYSSKFHEVQKFISMTGHMSQTQVPTISLKWWNTLSADQQKIISEAMIAAGDFQSELQIKDNIDQLEALKKAGIQVATPNQETFKEATKDVYNSFKDKFSKEFYDKMVNAQ